MISLNKLKEHFGDEVYKKCYTYIDILAHATNKEGLPNWKQRMFHKALRVAYFSNEDPIEYCKSLISGQDAVTLETYLDYQLAEKDFSVYYGGVREDRVAKYQKWIDENLNKDR